MWQYLYDEPDLSIIIFYNSGANIAHTCLSSFHTIRSFSCAMRKDLNLLLKDTLVLNERNFWRKTYQCTSRVIKMILRKGGLLKSTKVKSPVSQRLTGLCSGERGILYHSTIFRNSLIFKCRLKAFSLVLREKWRRTGARQNVLKHCVWMTFVT